jgi:hypothetical protein
MRTLSCSIVTGLVLLVMFAPEVQAQDQTPQQTQGSTQQSQGQSAQPIQAYHSPMAGLAGNSQSQDASGSTLVPDDHSLAGAEYLTLGAPKTGREFWMPYVDISSTLDSNPLSPSGGAGWSTWTSVFGGLDLHRLSGNSDFALSYLGAESISSDSGISNSTIQQFGVTERVTLRRSALIFLDQLAYLPESSFGYAGVGGPALQTGGSVGLQNAFIPDQSILTALGQRISNSFAVQSDTFLTPRSTLTLVGSYGILDFFGSDLNNNHEVTVQGGYNYLLTRKDTIAVLYRFDAFRYDHINQSINDDSVQLSYARRVTGRLALQISGGPDVAFSQIPINQSSTTSGATSGTGTTKGKTRQFFWDLTSSATYQLRRATLGANYNHGVSGGSGVLAGAITDNVSGSVSQSLTRTLRAAWTVGYSRNQGLVVSPTSASTSVNQTYDYWFTGVNLTRTLGRSINLYLGYQANYQTSNASFCLTANCGTSYLQNEIFMTVGWHPGPKTF